MSNPIIRIHNLETDEIIDREMTDAEYAEAVKLTEQKTSELAAKAQARQALLDKLGITEDEAKLLLGGN